DIEFFGGLPRFIFRVIFNIVKWLDEHNMPPYFMTKDMPFWSTGFVANLGSIGIDAVYHHLYNLGTVSIFLVIGKIKKEAILNQETEEIEVKEVVNLRISLDERILSGVEIGPIIDLLKKLIEHPETLMEKPDLTAEQLDALKLKKYKKERMKREKERKKKSQKKLNY
ncbi:MAG: 2-oxo acid dehydrogenase subunit E2, partial [Asgard group archaeon]|nr:2-oxo acid dehydrogenase subunit E2 [Asgard group archaeon]